jgi:hypothetical protein
MVRCSATTGRGLLLVLRQVCEAGRALVAAERWARGMVLHDVSPASAWPRGGGDDDMIGLPSIGPRLAKLLPLLASNQPGEVVATAAAITRALTKAGMDWHALAALVRSEAKRQAAPAFSFAGSAPKTARKQMAQMAWRPGITPADRARLERYRAFLLGKPVATRLPAEDVAWLDALWRQAFGAGA